MTDKIIEDLLADGNLSEIEGLDDDDLEDVPNFFDNLPSDDDLLADEEISTLREVRPRSRSPLSSTRASSPPLSPRPATPPLGTLSQPPISPLQIGARRRPGRGRSESIPRNVRIGRGRGRSVRARGNERSGRSISAPAPRSRTWKQVLFTDKPHNYTSLPVKPVRSPVNYFHEYIDNDFVEEIARCTNLYYMRKTGVELKTTASEICKLFSIHQFQCSSIFWISS